MKFAIITHVPHGINKGKCFAYAPYVREMNIWSKFIDELIIVAPLSLHEKTAIEIDYQSNNINLINIKQFNFLNFGAILKAIFHLPKITWIIFKTMKNADHIHLRCPGNVGLIACVVQIFFPNKSKTAKYAGNWDPNAKQPLSYKFQKWILSNTFLTKKMKVLVYGEWKNQSKNIKPFFTATYSKSDLSDIPDKSLDAKINFLFVGTLTSGKRPLYAVQLVEKLIKKNYKVHLDIYGNGTEIDILKEYILKNKLSEFVEIKGNQTKETIKSAYISSHFVILPSKSEGWPKVIAEAMFWKCLPIATQVSCIPHMLEHEKRGILLEVNLETDFDKISSLIKNETLYLEKVQNAMNWSRKYTVESFEDEIKLLIK